MMPTKSQQRAQNVFLEPSTPLAGIYIPGGSEIPLGETSLNSFYTHMELHQAAWLRLPCNIELASEAPEEKSQAPYFDIKKCALLADHLTKSHAHRGKYVCQSPTADDVARSFVRARLHLEGFHESPSVAHWYWYGLQQAQCALFISSCNTNGMVTSGGTPATMGVKTQKHGHAESSSGTENLECTPSQQKKGK